MERAFYPNWDRVGLFAVTLSNWELRWSPGLHTMLRVPSDMTPTWAMFEQMIYPDDRLPPELFYQRVRDATPFRCSYRATRWDGSTLLVSAYLEFAKDDAGRVTKLVGVLIDVTEESGQGGLSATGMLRFPDADGSSGNVRAGPSIE